MTCLQCIASVALLFMGVFAQVQPQQEGVHRRVVAENPNPQRLPTLAVWEDENLTPGRKLTHAEHRQEMPAELPFVNLCWQVRCAPSFASAPEP